MKNEDESRVHFWHSAERGPLWRHGRAHLTVRGRGCRWKYGTPETNPRYGKRGDAEFGAEWRVFPNSGFGLGAQFKWGTNGSDTTPDLSFHLGRLGDLWLHFGRVLPYRWFERHNADGTVDYDTRVFSLNLTTKQMRWEFWAREGSWSRSDPWWMQQTIDFRRVLFGKTVHSVEQIEQGVCTIPMPELNYPATFTVEKRTNRHTKRLGRLRDRVLGPRSWLTTNIEPGVGIPVPGKGENSWDCDDDHFYGMSCGGGNVDDAIGKMVASALNTRRRHGGEHMSVPAGAA